MTKAADHEKAQIVFTKLTDLLVLSQELVSEYLLAFRDESQGYEPTNYPGEPARFLKWCRLDDYATHHDARVQAEHDALLKRYGLAPESGN